MRRRTLKYNIRILLMSFFIIMCLSISLGSIWVNAKSKDEEIVSKYYTSILIHKGDSLWTIADEYMSEQYKSQKDYIKEVKSINNLSGDSIHAGQYLVIPYYSIQSIDL